MSRAKSTLEQWRILQAVVDHGGYAQAAEKLNKSQSSLNHAVAKLQHQLGIPLLEVKGRKAYLTEQGEVMLRRSRHLTQTVEELEQLAHNLEQGWEPSLTLGREIIYPMPLLVAALKAFLPDSRGTRVTILDTVLSGTNELINAQSVDISICAVPPKGYISEPLCEMEFYLVSHPSHPLAQLTQVDDDKQLAQHLQLVIKDTGTQGNSDTGWLKAEQRWTVANFHEAKEILYQGMGFCWMPKLLVEQDLAEDRLARICLLGSQSRKVMMSLVIPNRDRQGPAAKLLEQCILQQHKQAVSDIEQ